MTSGFMLILRTIRDLGGSATPPEIGEVMKVNQSGLGASFGKLLKLGYLEKERIKARKYRYILTRQGVEAATEEPVEGAGPIAKALRPSPNFGLGRRNYQNYKVKLKVTMSDPHGGFEEDEIELQLRSSSLTNAAKMVEDLKIEVVGIETD